MKRFLTALLIFAIIMGAIPTAIAAGPLDNFKKQRNYDSRFIDVRKTDWFYDSVKMGFEFELIDGVSESSFSPISELTLAEVLALASKLHSIYANGKPTFTQGSPWYQVYVEYARKNGFLPSGMNSFNRAALREEVAAILAKALPTSAFPSINSIDDNAIPDVKMDSPNASAIYTLYRAGILTGSDSYGTFHPYTSIKRSEIAAIVTRIADPASRERKTLENEALYFAFFDVASDNNVKSSIPGLVVRFYGNVSIISQADFTNIVLTRDGKVIDNPLILSDEVLHFEWSYEEVTDFRLNFKQEITEPGRYGLMGQYKGIPFTVYDKIIEKPVGSAPANSADLCHVGWCYMEGPDGKTKNIGEVVFSFNDTQQSFYQSDLANLKLTRNGTQIAFSLQSEVIRYLEAQEVGVITQYNIYISGSGITEPGTYMLTGTYRGKSFTSMEISIP